MSTITFLLGVAVGIFAMCLRRSLPDGRQGQAIQYCKQIRNTWGAGPWEVAQTVIDILDGRQ